MNTVFFLFTALFCIPINNSLVSVILPSTYCRQAHAFADDDNAEPWSPGQAGTQNCISWMTLQYLSGSSGLLLFCPRISAQITIHSILCIGPVNSFSF